MAARWFDKPRLGIALGAGAARGLAHIGVLQVLEEHGIQVDVVAGTSMGAIVGALYLLEGNASRLVNRMYDFFESEAFKDAEFDVLREQRAEEDPGWFESWTGIIRRGIRYSLSVTRKSIISREVFERIIEELIPDLRVEDLPRPFAAVSLDAVSGQEVIWTRGSLRHALWSSSAIPGFFPPLELDGRVLVDGGWTNAVPVGPALDLGAERAIAVDISREVEEIIEYKRGLSLILRSAVLTSKKLRELQLEEADLVLRPEVGHIHWADFSNPEEIIQKGRDATLVNLDQLKRLKRALPAPQRWVVDRMRAMVDDRPWPRSGKRRTGS